MQELDFINARLGGHKITLEGIRTMMKRMRTGSKGKNEKLSILEIGCGGGDNLRVIKVTVKRKILQFNYPGSTSILIALNLHDQERKMRGSNL